MTLSYELDLYRVKKNHRAKSRSKVISFDSYHANTQTDTHTQ